MEHEIPELGRRILVWGAMGAGKSTVACHVATALELPVIDLSTVRYDSSCRHLAAHEMAPKLRKSLEMYTLGWVFDGSDSKIDHVTLPRADTVIWLHLPLRVSFWRLLKRTARYRWESDLLRGWARMSWEVFTRRSYFGGALRTHVRHARTIRRQLEELADSVRVYELRTAREVETFLHEIEATVKR